MNLPFIKLFADSSETIEMLSEAEAGRLLKSLLRYLNDQEPILSGNEKFVYAMLKAQIDRDAAGYQAYIDKQRENGSKGGRPRKNPKNPTVFNENPKNQTVLEKTQKTQEINIDIDHDIDTDEDMDTHTIIQQPGNAPARVREGWFDPENPESGDDHAWEFNESARKATAQRMIGHLINSGKMRFQFMSTENDGPVGEYTLDVLCEAMNMGVTPQICMLLSQGCSTTWQWEYAIKKHMIDMGIACPYEWERQVREIKLEL